MTKRAPHQAPPVTLSLPSRFLKYIRQSSLVYYYRYSVEIGISSLEGWEAFIVNSLFLLLIVSIIKQTVKAVVFLTGYAKHLITA
ncbi:hypothetical protein NEDG_01198 [Nematocida displodere]|uniref:Uncharacterized protein n=1 Tax=Nematocida displodere TaxID=1805483 RepID=A0A177EDI8_9MICR|nr:hypothetical protein NEDG_01198 [Nematocida displodere]